MKEREGMSTVDQIAHDYLEKNSELEPNAASSRGTLGHDSELTDYSPQGEAARAELARTTLRQVDEVAPETAPDRLGGPGGRRAPTPPARGCGHSASPAR